MSEKKYLDIAGLEHFWGKVKTYVNKGLSGKQDTIDGNTSLTVQSLNTRGLTLDDYSVTCIGTEINPNEAEEVAKAAIPTNYAVINYVNNSVGNKVYSSSPFRVGEIIVGAEDEDNKVKGSTVFISEVIKGLSVSGTTITYTKGDGNTGTITTQDTNDAVTQNYSTTNNSYPLLMTATAGVTSTSTRGATTSILSNKLYANPNTGILTVYDAEYESGVSLGVGLNGWDEEGTISIKNSNSEVIITGAGKIDWTDSNNNNYTLTLPSQTGTIATQTYVNEAIADLGDVLEYKGTVKTYDDLLKISPLTGDVYNVTAACDVYNNVTNAYDSYPAGTNFAWNGDAWDALGGAIDLSGYQLKSDLVAITTGEIDGICTA